MLTFIALVSLYSFLLLVKTKFVVSGSFGDIGGTLYGPWMRLAILSSIVISQLGFVSAYTIFVSENLSAFVEAVSHCAKSFGILLCLPRRVGFLVFALARGACVDFLDELVGAWSVWKSGGVEGGEESVRRL